jgi:Spy/CpxP family protein refolding chaperone
VLASLNQLHAILTPEQRSSLVAKLESRHAKGPRHDAKDKPRRAFDKDAKLGKHAGRHEFKLLRGLELTDAQREQLSAALDNKLDPAVMRQAHEQRRQQHQAMLKAFATPSFDAAKFMDGSAPARHGRERAEHQVKFVERALTVLTPEQRQQAAARFNERRRFKH